MSYDEIMSVVDYSIGNVIVSMSYKIDKYIDKIVVDNNHGIREFTGFNDFVSSLALDSLIKGGKIFNNIQCSIHYKDAFFEDIMNDITQQNLLIPDKINN